MSGNTGFGVVSPRGTGGAGGVMSGRMLSARTVAVAAGRPAEPGAPLNTPLVPASAFAHGGGREYARDDGSPTWQALEQAVGALDEHSLAAEPSHDLRKLHAGWPATQHEQAARDRLHARRLAGAPYALELTQSRDRRHVRIRPRRHDDVLGGVPDTLDLDHARAGQTACAAQ